MTASPGERLDKPRKGTRFWRILPWVLLAVVAVVLCVRWGFREYALAAASKKMNERFEGMKGPFEFVDFWKGGEGYQVMRYRTSGSLFGEADCVLVFVPPTYYVILEEDVQTHELTSVSITRDIDQILSASKSGQAEGPFPNSFTLAPQTGPDAGNWLFDKNADGIFDFKVVGPLTSSTKCLRWEEGKGWVECVWDDAPEEAKQALPR
ncbi:MAG TPA: hypothetical protein VFH53_03510 [Phycisphaerae bacterium]|nr:hypothetical protein [Phycisphaerae bacterium]